MRYSHIEDDSGDDDNNRRQYKVRYGNKSVLQPALQRYIQGIDYSQCVHSRHSMLRLEKSEKTESPRREEHARLMLFELLVYL